MTSTIGAIIFDCDGTLVDSETPGLDVLHEEAVKLGVTMTREQAHAEFRGKRMSLCVEAIGNRLPHWSADFEADFTATVRAAMAARFRQGLAPLPGALALVARLKQPFCVATNGPREKAELTLGLTGLLPWFSNRVFCAYEVGFWKPDPRLFLHAAQALGVPAAACAWWKTACPGLRRAWRPACRCSRCAHPARCQTSWPCRQRPSAAFSTWIKSCTDSFLCRQLHRYNTSTLLGKLATRPYIHWFVSYYLNSKTKIRITFTSSLDL